jgi:SAM-dependent methyltransferase
MASDIHRFTTTPAGDDFALRVEPPPWACPKHQEALRSGDTSLSCPEGEQFPILRGIPRFVFGRTYSDTFGLQWMRFRRTQLDSYTRTTLSRERARRCLGEGLFENLARFDVLECGCGAGRFTEVLLREGARVTSVDLSNAVEANEANCPTSERHRIAQADILQLPFVPRSFDVVFCLGVVQHTPSPEETIGTLYEQVRPGGWLVFDCYRHHLRWILSTAPLFRSLLRRLPPEHGLAVTDWLARRLFPVHRVARGVFGTLLRRLSPVQTYYHVFPELCDDLQREWSLLDTHDVLTDWYKHYRTSSQILSLLRELGLEQIWVGEGGNGVEARGRRPLSV